MLYGEKEVRDNIRNRDGRRVFFLGKGDTLTPGARDWLSRERIEIRSAQEAKIETYRLSNGAFMREKPEYMTHLHGDVLVEKTHPRIAFRGAVDALEAELLLCQLDAEPVRKELGEILDLTRLLIRCEVMDEPVPQKELCGMTQEQIRHRSHFPQDYYAVAHFMPEYTDGRLILQLNRCRSTARAAELAAVRAFAREGEKPQREDILKAMNRISSMLYILMLQQKAGKAGGCHGKTGYGGTD